MKKPNQIKKPYPLRVDDDLLNDVRELALESERSVNSEFRYLVKVGIRTIKNNKKWLDLND